MEKNTSQEKLLVHTQTDRVELFQNVPNPFSAQTIIAFKVPRGQNWMVRVEDNQGQSVRVFSGNEGGTMTLIWDGTDDAGAGVQTGTYFCLLESDGNTDLRKMTLIR